jgi:hypothetical protein
MLSNMIVGTGGNMNQIHRTTLQCKSNIVFVDVLNKNIPIIESDYMDDIEEIVLNNDYTHFNELEVPIRDLPVDIINNVPVISTAPIYILHQYVPIMSAYDAIDVVDHNYTVIG